MCLFCHLSWAHVLTDCVSCRSETVTVASSWSSSGPVHVLLGASSSSCICALLPSRYTLRCCRPLSLCASPRSLCVSSRPVCAWPRPLSAVPCPLCFLFCVCLVLPVCVVHLCALPCALCVVPSVWVVSKPLVWFCHLGGVPF